MQIVSTFDDLVDRLDSKKSCITIGVFDGVHLGHQALLNETVKKARARNMVSLAITFRNHPLSVLAPPYAPRKLVSPARKANLLAGLGIDVLLMMEFTAAFASTSPTDFVEKWLVASANLGSLVCGYDFTFGKHGAGNLDLLKSIGERRGFDVESLAAVSQHNLAVKSTHIRDQLSGGKVGKAAKLLSRPHEVPGIVGSGMQRGRTIGFPTANLRIPEICQLPAQGVYVCGARVGMEQSVFPAMVNIGTNPTFGNNSLSVEAYILGFDRDIHNQPLNLFFLERLRNEQKFPSIDALVAQLNSDKNQTSQVWESSAIQELAATIPEPVDHAI